MQRPVFHEDHPIRRKLEHDHGVQFVRFIGRGGFNEVWHVNVDDADVALKISIEPLDDGDGKTAKELDSLEFVKNAPIREHAHIVTYFGRWMVNDYLITRWELGSRTLLDLMNACLAEGKSGIPIDDLICTAPESPGYMLQIASAVDFFNEQGDQHRDIKPSNIVLFGQYAKVADFGLAAFIGVSTYHRSRSMGLGTLGYMASEAHDGEWGQTSDLYSATATYVKVRTGLEPFGENVGEILERQRNGNPIVDGLKPFEIALVRHGLAPNPADRPQDGAVNFFKLFASANAPGFSVAAGYFPKPDEVQVKEVEVPAIIVEAKPVALPQPTIEGLPPVGQEILDLQGLMKGLEQDIAELEAEKHSCLRPAQAAIAEAQRQYEELSEDLAAHEAELPKNVKSTIAVRIQADPATSVFELVDLFPAVPPRSLLPSILRHRNVGLAQRELTTVQDKYENERQQQTQSLKRQRDTTKAELNARQRQDFHKVVGEFFERLDWPDLFPIAEWSQFQPLLAARGYAWDEREMLRMAETILQLHEGEERLRQAARMAPNDAKAHQELGYFLRNRAGCYPDAEDALRKAIEMDPKNAYAWSHLGFLCCQFLQRYEDAEEALRTAIEVDPQCALAWSYLGSLYGDKLDRYEEAEEAYRKAIELDPQHAKVWHDLGILYRKGLNRYEDAEKAFRKVIELDARHAEAWNNLGNLYRLDLNRYQEAEQAYRKAIEIEPQGATAWHNLGFLYHVDLRRYEDAKEAFQRARELKSE